MSKIKVRSLDTVLILFAMLSPLAPTYFAKPLVAVAIGLIALRVLPTSGMKKFPAQKILNVFIFFIPLSVAAVVSPEDLVRFAPILLLCALFPLSALQLNPLPIARVTAGLLVFLITTQILIALGNGAVVEMRDNWYPIETNVWEYGVADSVFYDYGSFRAAGIFYNPNVLGLMLVLYYFLFASVQEYAHAASKKGFIKTRLIFYTIFIMTLFSVYLTGSRTAILGFLIFLILKVSGIRFEIKSLLTPRAMMASLGGLAFFGYFLADRVYQGLVETQGSANIKISILLNHLQSSDLTTLLFGGVYNRQFDAEYGYWIGAGGLLGLIAVFMVFYLYFRYIRTTRPIVIALALMGIGNTVFYGLLTGVVAFVTLGVVTNLEVNAGRKKHSVESTRYELTNSTF